METLTQEKTYFWKMKDMVSGNESAYLQKES